VVEGGAAVTDVVERRIVEIDIRTARNMAAELKQINSSVNSIEKGFSSLSGIVKEFGAGLLGAFSVGGFVAFVKNSIDAAAALSDMAAATGSSVENLSRLQQVAKISGTDMESVASALGNLNTALHENEKGSRNTEAALKAIGLSIKDLKDLDPAETMRLIAVNMEKYADGGGKAAAMTVLLGDASKKTASYVHDLATAGAVNAKVTAEQAQKADEFNKQLRRITTEAKDAGEAMARELIPVLARILEQFTSGITAAGGFWASFRAVANINPFLEVGENLKNFNLQLETLEKKRAELLAQGRTGWAAQMDENIAIKKQQIAYLKLIQQQQALATTAGMSGRLDPRDLGPTPPKPPLPFRKPEPPKKDGGKEISDFERMTEALDDQLASMNQAVSLTPQYDKALRRLADTVSVLTPQQQLLGMAQVFYVAQMEQAQIKEKERVASLKDLEDALKDQRTETDKYFVELDRLYKLIALYPARTLELQTAIAALTDSFLESQKKTKEVVNENAKLLESIADKVDGYAKSISGSLVDFITSAGNAKFSFKDFVTSVLQDLARMTTQMLLVEPIMSKLQASMRQFITGGQYSWQKGLVAPSTEQLAQPVVNAAGAALAARIFGQAKGGVFTSPSLSQYSGGVYDKPRLFSYAKGGVFAEAGPEAIMPLSRGPDGSLGVDASGAGVVVNVYNESRAEVTTKTRSDVNGNRIIELMVKDAVSAGFRSGAFDGVMGTTYGLNRQGAR
jgi:lambda family phage tail tape measure protein